MTKRFSSTRHSGYPVVVDNKNEEEMTLDTVVNSLNEYEWMQRSNIREYNQLREKLDYISEKKEELKSQNGTLKRIICIMILIIIFETLFILGIR